MCGETCIEGSTGHHDAQTVWPDQPYSVFVRGALGSFCQRSRTVAQPGGNDESACRADLTRFVDKAYNSP